MKRLSLFALAAAALAWVALLPAGAAPAKGAAKPSGPVYAVNGVVDVTAGDKAAAVLTVTPTEKGKQRALELTAETQLTGWGIAGTLTGIEAIRPYLHPDMFVTLKTARKKPTVAKLADPANPLAVSGVVAAAEVVCPPGFTPLFNGKDLTNWQGLVEIKPQLAMKGEPDKLAAAVKAANDRDLPHWVPQEGGVLHYDGKAQSLQTTKWYKDFDLYVDWKVPPGGDSGLYLRGAPPVQIWDSKSNPVGSGGLYNNQKKENPANPLKCADKPAGEWNTFHVIMKGEKVSVWLNGELVVDNVTLENYWDRSIPIYPEGPIELQNHTSPLDFKNIFIKELP